MLHPLSRIQPSTIRSLGQSLSRKIWFIIHLNPRTAVRLGFPQMAKFWTDSCLHLLSFLLSYFIVWQILIYTSYCDLIATGNGLVAKMEKETLYCGRLIILCVCLVEVPHNKDQPFPFTFQPPLLTLLFFSNVLDCPQLTAGTDLREKVSADLHSHFHRLRDRFKGVQNPNGIDAFEDEVIFALFKVKEPKFLGTVSAEWYSKVAQMLLSDFAIENNLLGYKQPGVSSTTE